MRMFSMFKVFDYKGGEVSSSVNIDLDQIVGELLESMKGGYEAWDLPEAEMREFFANAEIETDLYAYQDSDNFCGEIYEHKDGKLIENLRVLGAGWKNIPKTTTVRYGVATGKWKTVSIYSCGEKFVKGKHYIFLAFWLEQTLGNK